MEYISVVISTIVFFISFGFFVMAWSKKPSKTQTLELKEAGEEITKQIQEATEESVLLIEKKIAEMEQKYHDLNEQYRKKLQDESEIQLKKMEEQVMEKSKSQKDNSKQKEDSLFELNEKDVKMNRILQMHKKGFGLNKIANEMNMNIGVVQVYLNLLKMNKIG